MSGEDIIEYDYPFRLRVQMAITKSFESIKQRDALGKQIDRDFTGHVHRGRDIYGYTDDLPMISLLEPPLPLDQFAASQSNPATAGLWDLMVQGFVKDDHSNPTDPAHWLMADVKAVLAAEKARKLNNNPNPFGLGVVQWENGKGVGNVVLEIVSFGPGVVRPPEAEISDKAFFWLGLTLKVVENNLRPFV